MALAKDSKPLDFIQALRGIAALVVVLWHGSRFLSPYGTGIGWSLFGSGRTMGVDLFFVISGFIMVYTTVNNDGSKRYCANYFKKRLLRIWPPYVILTLIYILVSSGLSYFSDPDHLRRFAETLTFIPTANPLGAPMIELPPLPVGWTLNYEMYFYFIFGVSLLFGRLRWAAFFGWIALTLMAFPYFTGHLTLDTTKDFGYSHAYMALMTSPLVWLFVAGVVVGLIYKTRLKIDNPFYAKFLLGVTTMLLMWQYSSGIREEHGLLNSGLSIIPFFLIICLASKTLPLRLPKFLIYLGDISFSLYLIHPLVQERLQVFLDWNNLSFYTKGPAFLTFTTMVSICLAALSYRYIERGLPSWIKARRSVANHTAEASDPSPVTEIVIVPLPADKEDRATVDPAPVSRTPS